MTWARRIAHHLLTGLASIAPRFLRLASGVSRLHRGFAKVPVFADSLVVAVELQSAPEALRLELFVQTLIEVAAVPAAKSHSGCRPLVALCLFRGAVAQGVLIRAP